MNVFTNEQYLKDQMKSARRLQLAGYASIGIVFLISCPVFFGANYPTLLYLLAYPFLFIGFPLLTMGNNRTRLLKRTPRDDQLITGELKGLNNKYSLHHYLQIGGTVVKHLVIAPSGAVVIISRDTVGPVTCSQGTNGDRWRVRTSFLERLSGMRTPIGNPSADAASAIEHVKTLLTEIGKPNVPVYGLIAFTRQQDLELESCTYPAVPLDETKSAIRDLLASSSGGREEGLALDQMLTSEDRRRLNSRLVPDKLAAPPAKPASAQR